MLGQVLAKCAQNYLCAWYEEHFAAFWDKKMWLSSSPDLNVMDFAVQVILEDKVFNKAPEKVRAISAAAPRHKEAVVRNNGGYFE